MSAVTFKARVTAFNKLADIYVSNRLNGQAGDFDLLNNAFHLVKSSAAEAIAEDPELQMQLSDAVNRMRRIQREMHKKPIAQPTEPEADLAAIVGMLAVINAASDMVDQAIQKNEFVNIKRLLQPALRLLPVIRATLERHPGSNNNTAIILAVARFGERLNALKAAEAYAAVKKRDYAEDRAQQERVREHVAEQLRAKHQPKQTSHPLKPASQDNILAVAIAFPLSFIFSLPFADVANWIWYSALIALFLLITHAMRYNFRVMSVRNQMPLRPTMEDQGEALNASLFTLGVYIALTWPMFHYLLINDIFVLIFGSSLALLALSKMLVNMMMCHRIIYG